MDTPKGKSSTQAKSDALAENTAALQRHTEVMQRHTEAVHRLIEVMMDNGGILKQNMKTTESHREALLSFASPGVLEEGLTTGARKSDEEIEDAVMNCIANASGGKRPAKSTPLKAVPVDPNDLIECLNESLELKGKFEYETDEIAPDTTVRQLIRDAGNRHKKSNP